MNNTIINNIILRYNDIYVAKIDLSVLYRIE